MEVSPLVVPVIKLLMIEVSGVVPLTKVVAVKLLKEGEGTTLIVGLVIVPPVKILIPADTELKKVVAVDKNIEDKGVLPE